MQYSSRRSSTWDACAWDGIASASRKLENAAHQALIRRHRRRRRRRRRLDFRRRRLGRHRRRLTLRPSSPFRLSELDWSAFVVALQAAHDDAFRLWFARVIRVSRMLRLSYGTSIWV